MAIVLAVWAAIMLAVAMVLAISIVVIIIIVLAVSISSVLMPTVVVFLVAVSVILLILIVCPGRNCGNSKGADDEPYNEQAGVFQHNTILSLRFILQLNFIGQTCVGEFSRSRGKRHSVKLGRSANAEVSEAR
jgi:hypothetical protein